MVGEGAGAREEAGARVVVRAVSRMVTLMRAGARVVLAVVVAWAMRVALMVVVVVAAGGGGGEGEGKRVDFRW